MIIAAAVTPPATAIVPVKARMPPFHLRADRGTGPSTDDGARRSPATAAYGTTNDRACGAAKKRSAKDIFLCRGLLYRHR